jgi:hypothetical protein
MIFQSLLYKNEIMLSYLVVDISLPPHNNKNKLSDLFFTYAIGHKL